MIKKFAPWVSAIMCLSAAGGCADRETAQFPRWEAERLAIVNAPVPPIPLGEQTVAAENAYRACLVRAARFLDTGAADAENLAALIAPLCYPQFSTFEAAADSAFSDRDRRVFDHAGDQRQIDLASEAVRAERSQAASSSAGTSRTAP